MTFLKNSFFYIILYLVPKNLFSRLLGYLVSLKLPQSLVRVVNRIFVKKFNLNMQEAQKPLNDYMNLQDLFTRRLKVGARIIDGSDDIIISPCDGLMSEAGRIEQGRLLQIKGKYYKISDLLGSSKCAQRFENGYFATIYLSPRDYHRFHVPVDGQIKKTIYVPGSLWPVNRWAVATIKNLFCQNERIISFIEPKGRSKMLAHVAVGACVVGKIKLAYCPLESNSRAGRASFRHDVDIQKGKDLGVFMFGSTIILLFEAGLIDGLLPLAPSPVRMGQPLARMIV